MTLTYTNNGDGTETAQITYTAATPQVADVLTAAARQLYLLGYLVPMQPADPDAPSPQPVPWADVTNTQRRAMLDRYIRHTILELSRGGQYKDAVEAATAAAIAALPALDLP